MTEENQKVQELDRKDLKILSYKSSIADLQDRISEYQVDLTIVSERLKNVTLQLQELQEQGQRKNVEAPGTD
jgi:chromosome segregation ATPase